MTRERTVNEMISNLGIFQVSQSECAWGGWGITFDSETIRFQIC